MCKWQLHVVVTDMKLLLLCIAIVGLVAAKQDDELALMKRLLQALEQEDFAAGHGRSGASGTSGASDSKCGQRVR